jgi:hypothetical protein
MFYSLGRRLCRPDCQSGSAGEAPAVATRYKRNLMCIGPCIVVINEEEEPNRCYLVFYYTYERLNVIRAALCPSSGAHDYISDYHMDHMIIRLLMVGS